MMNKIINDKKAMEFSFAWIFSIIVGAVILFLAIYTATRFISTSEYQINTETAKRFLNIMNPLQTSLESGKANSIELQEATRIYTNCNNQGTFGNSVVSFSEKFGLKDEWSKPGGALSEKTAYLFAEDVVEGKKIYFIINPVKMPFKTADAISMYSETYCFANPPDSIEEELSAIGNSANIIISDSLSDCPEKSRRVCFNSNCNISVICSDNSCTNGAVKKGSSTLNLAGGLLYPAVFSSEKNYECNLKRIMTRLSLLSEVYSEKASFISVRGCNTALQPDMAILSSSAKEYTSSKDLASISILAQLAEQKNKELSCKLF